jgi:perosamine synthetase
MYIPFGLPTIGAQEKKLVNKVLSQPILAHGKQTKEFELEFKKFTNAKYALTTSSCTAGMHLFYMANNIKDGDEVIMPAQTHVATAHAIEAVGAKPIFIDSDNKTGNIDIKKIENAITKKTKVITVVHFVGIPVNMIEICKIAKKYNLLVLEDCALSLGAKINNIHTGLWGDAGVFSFYPVKHITTGEGGMIISKDKKLKKKLAKLKSLGINKNFNDRKTPGLYDCDSFGLNLRMSELNSAIGKIQLKKIKSILNLRKKNFNYLSSRLKYLNSIRVIKNNEKNLKSSNYCLVIILKNKILVNNRNEIIKYLNKKGIGTSIYYPNPVPYMSFYKKKYKLPNNLFLNAKEISNDSISLPIGPHLNQKKLNFIFLNLKKIISQVENK